MRGYAPGDMILLEEGLIVRERGPVTRTTTQSTIMSLRTLKGPCLGLVVCVEKFNELVVSIEGVELDRKLQPLITVVTVMWMTTPGTVSIMPHVVRGLPSPMCYA